MLKRTLAFLVSVVIAVTTVVVFSAASDKNAFTVSIAPNPALDANFDRKEKTKDRGWKIYIRFTNKTDKPIRSIGTEFEMREGGWLIRDDRTQTSSTSPLLMRNQSAVFAWIDGVPSSVDRIHIKKVETE